MSDPIAIPPCELTLSEVEDLRLLAGLMIPANHDFGVPGADDLLIVTDMARSPGRDLAALKRMLGIASRQLQISESAALGSTDVSALLQRLKELDPGGFAALEAVIARAYYRDDRVLQSIGMEPRPPFPLGYVVDGGDWALLEPVKARGPIWRDAGS